MFVELDHEQHRLLVELVEARIAEIVPELRRSQDFKFHDRLKHDHQVFKAMLSKLHQAEIDVQA